MLFDPKTIEQQLSNTGFAAAAERILQFGAPCLRIRTLETADVEPPIGGSRFGGLPDVPADFEWPMWNEVPLAFLAQINLSDVGGNPICAALPKTGLLSVFYDPGQETWGFDPNDRGSWRVYLFKESGLVRAEAPVEPDAGEEDLSDEEIEDLEGLTTVDGESLLDNLSAEMLQAGGEWMVNPPCSISFEEAWTISTAEAEELAALFSDEQQSEEFLDFLYNDDMEDPCHHLLGHPQEVQGGEMKLECQLVSNGIYAGGPEGFEDPRVAELEKGADEWMLLLQLGTDDNPGWMWGDVGRLYFWIKKSDLRQEKFDDVWMILQCG